MLLCCGPRAPPPVLAALGRPPPPEFCGYWCENPRSVIQRFGTKEGREVLELPPPPAAAGPVAWLVVDAEERLVEWRQGEAVNGAVKNAISYKGPVKEWGKETWATAQPASGGKSSLRISDLEYTVHEGVELLTAFNVDDHRLERTFMVSVGAKLQAAVMLSEAGDQRESCLDAMVEIKRSLEAKAEREAGASGAKGKLQLADAAPSGESGIPAPT
eukprot:TRINITY_DN28324_c0_g1_i1.p1 TRINITY_DN28324_c0_g1~~TRINITY_DN28324_c0_g1_i1.p1  ORF type:complete len:216 (+),score=42.98 TRINITY_DN28324_c0_g1_i1:127-774(+)